jgi:anti-anti-sigma regulatory factor
MEVKINTKEKFTVLTPQDINIYDKMAADLAAVCNRYLRQDIKNVIINLECVKTIDEKIVITIVELQKNFGEHSASFVVCCLQPEVEQLFIKLNVLAYINYAPTESEAWDIVQMEEIEREFFDEEDE